MTRKTKKHGKRGGEEPIEGIVVQPPPKDKHNPNDRDPDILGRPTKYTGLSCPIVQMLLKCLSKDYTVEEASAKAGIAKQTFYNWIKEHAEFAEAVQIAYQIPFTKAKDNVVAKVEDGDIDTSIWLLEHRQRDRYAKRSENLTNTYEPLTDEENQQLNKALKNAGLR